MEAWRTSVPVVPVVPIVPIIPVVLIAPVVPIVPVVPIAPVVPIVPVVVITPVVLIAPVVLIVSNVSIVSMFQRTIDPLLVSDKVQGACGSQEADSVPPGSFFFPRPTVRCRPGCRRKQPRGPRGRRRSRRSPDGRSWEQPFRGRRPCGRRGSRGACAWRRR